MTIEHLNKDLLASTAVFAEMANNNVSLKQVLSEFVLATYSLKSTFTQTSNEVVSALSTHFEFEIPDAVVRTILKKLKKDSILEQVNGSYSIGSEERKKWESLFGRVEQKESEQKEITDQLIKYVELQRGKLDDHKKSELLQCFSEYLFDESFEDEYSDLVSAFIIRKSQNQDFSKELNLIREGITILKGVKYSPDINEIQPWRKPLTIFLDTEHLFSINGYNGEIYKKLVSDLVELIRSINQQQQKNAGEKAIQFKYLEETELEVKNFFYAARKIISGETSRGHSSVAMDTILKGSSTSSDVIRKETEFFGDLKSLGITKQKPIELYDNHHLNVEDASIYKKYESECDDDVISSILKSFTAVNILRKGNNRNSFENIGHIIMTGSAIKLKISSDLDAKIEDGDFSYATHIYYVTQRLWFRLNKGLGFNNQLPSSLDVVIKAQTLLSNHLNSSVRERYNKLEKDVESGKRTLEAVQDYYINLRTNVVKPEELVPENVEERVKFLYDESDIENFKEEQSLLKQKADAYDQLQKKLNEKAEQEERDKRKALIEECKEIYNACTAKYIRNKWAYRSFLALVFTLLIYGIYFLISPTDTPISIIAFALTVIGFIVMIKWKKIDSQIQSVSFAKFRSFMTQNSIEETELEN
ncbi:hypothetical protein [Ekhidna sp. To15]|uniref:hypothetical protein n=1 Tax=Ekhidna sp. To15 TaxID=3395267 RepID=UPI003F51BB22